MAFGLGLAVAYALILRHYLRHWAAMPNWVVPEGYVPRTKVAVLVAARNEEAHIGTCVEAILSQDYPPHLLQVVVVDDHSDDDTTKVVRQFLPDGRLQLLHLADFTDEKTLTAPKKKALAVAIAHTDTALIVTTDADCVPPPQWLRHLAHCHETTGAGFIAAPVVFRPDEGALVVRFQALDFMGMMLLTGAGIRSRLQYMCNGANLAYTRALFEQVGGFGGIDGLASGDDMLLQHKVAATMPEAITFLKAPGAVVPTPAQPTWRAFVAQRVRWGTKSAGYAHWQVTAILALVFLLCWGILVGILAALVWPLECLPVLGAMLLAKIWPDYLLLKAATQWFGRPSLMRVFPVAQGAHLIYIAWVGLLSNVRKGYVWKGRRLR